jgi:hypothetical protein
MNTKELTLSDYVAELGITAKVTQLSKIPAKDNKDNWAKQGWRITLKYNNRSMGFNFYGGGSVKTPTVSDGVWCMAIESAGAINNTFDEWAKEFDYSTDSRNALNTYRTIKRNAAKFTDLIANEQVLNKLIELAYAY